METKRAFAGWNVDLLIGANDAVLGRVYSTVEGNVCLAALCTFNNKALCLWSWEVFEHGGQGVTSNKEAFLETLKSFNPVFVANGRYVEVQAALENALKFV